MLDLPFTAVIKLPNPKQMNVTATNDDTRIRPRDVHFNSQGTRIIVSYLNHGFLWVPRWSADHLVTHGTPTVAASTSKAKSHRFLCCGISYRLTGTLWCTQTSFLCTIFVLTINQWQFSIITRRVYAYSSQPQRWPGFVSALAQGASSSFQVSVWLWGIYCIYGISARRNSCHWRV